MSKKMIISKFQCLCDLKKLLNERVKVTTASTDFVMIFAGQRPITAILIFSGSMELEIRNKTLKIDASNTLFLFDEFLRSKEIKCKITILAGTEYCWADKNLIDSLLNSDKISSVSTCR